MHRRGFFGAVVLTTFSLPKIVERIWAANPNAAAAPRQPVSVSATWTNANNTAGTAYTFTRMALWNANGNPIITPIWYPPIGGL